MPPRENATPNSVAIVRSKLDQGFPPEHVGKGKMRAARSMPPTRDARERRHRRPRTQPEYDFRRPSYLHSSSPGSDQSTHQTTTTASTANRTSPASPTSFQPCVRVPHWTKDATLATAPFLSHRKDATKQHTIRLLEDATPAGHSSPDEGCNNRHDAIPLPPATTISPSHP